MHICCVQGPVTPIKKATQLSTELPTSMATFAENLKKQKQSGGIAVIAVQNALDADPHGKALYHQLVQLNHDGDVEAYSIKKNDFFKSPAGMAYRVLSAEEMHKDVVKGLQLKPLYSLEEMHEEVWKSYALLT